ncbi:hypothetical protein JUN65_03015 [Gluconacetobacter azotocaptans]|uniref:CCE_0567 family metalloprotein n=1 Tax=Gluconacetobacter azotocaptans TaxID=142834 RepID=UPI00195AC7D5|nr:CCE_0567 family metalloprotein [Gluconacetobacter azotocaptans]MBM9400564.1 hypothetical protein [Gluconacetobacter azotocaptans]
MGDIETLRAELKKLSARATKAKMDLHDLSEDLPVNWQSITEVAARAQAAYAELTEKREALKVLEERVEH